MLTMSTFLAEPKEFCASQVYASGEYSVVLYVTLVLF